MSKKFVYVLVVVTLLFIACSSKKNGNDSDGKIRVVTTTGMIADAVENVGGELVKVQALMGPGIDPHLYKASEGDVTRMARANIIFYNGLHLEGKMTDVFEQMRKRVKTVAVTDQIDRDKLESPPEYEGNYDPHVWFDVSMWMKVVGYIRDVLVEFNPENAEIYKNNADNYLKKLRKLHEYVSAKAEAVAPEKRVLITAHDAFNYFGNAYGFEVRGLQGISTASEAGTADVQNLADFIVERKIPAMFVETSVPPRYIEALQAAVKSRGFNVKIGGNLFSDAMGEKGTPLGNYLGMVRHNIDTIVNALTKPE